MNDPVYKDRFTVDIVYITDEPKLRKKGLW